MTIQPMVTRELLLHDHIATYLIEVVQFHH